MGAKEFNLDLHHKFSDNVIKNIKVVYSKLGESEINEISFTTALIQKGYVGFYFMPVYTESDMVKVFGTDLLICLKGKSCFHLKNFDKKIFKEIEVALSKGYEIYKKNGFVD